MEEKLKRSISATILIVLNGSVRRGSTAMVVKDSEVSIVHSLAGQTPDAGYIWICDYHGVNWGVSKAEFQAALR